jgi:site-specific DNA-methyltransferase (cytosine-N4-specific)
MPRPPSSDPKEFNASVRLGGYEKHIVETRMRDLGISSVGEYVRRLIQQDGTGTRPKIANTATENKTKLTRVLTLSHGVIWNGNSLDHMRKAEAKSVDLIMTSPPFGLVRKKSYGNEDAHNYCDWFRPFAEGFRQVLKDQGSLVIDVGGAWKKGTPTRSLYHYELLLMLCNDYGFHLCQEHYWWNPSKLPTPAEWVNIRRVRVKDAVNCVWWLSPTPWPKASNRRILAPYSEAMRHLLLNGYAAKTRPSGHRISKKFGKDNGGAVPPNLLAIANTESNGVYQDYCRNNDLTIHPARFPALLPEYFIRMLTNPGDRILDPFAGSCVTGMVAEALGRKWDCVELNRHFLEGAVGRFAGSVVQNAGTKPSSYLIHTPCGAGSHDISLSEDGGKTLPESLAALEASSASSNVSGSLVSGLDHIVASAS